MSTDGSSYSLDTDEQDNSLMRTKGGKRYFGIGINPS